MRIEETHLTAETAKVTEVLVREEQGGHVRAGKYVAATALGGKNAVFSDFFLDLSAGFSIVRMCSWRSGWSSFSADMPARRAIEDCDS